MTPTEQASTNAMTALSRRPRTFFTKLKDSGNPNDIACPLHSYPTRVSYFPPICHRTTYAPQTGYLNNLFVPAQQDAHGSAGRLVSSVRPSNCLAETCLLWCDTRRCSRSTSASLGRRCAHALVTIGVAQVSLCGGRWSFGRAELIVAMWNAGLTGIS